MSQLYEIPLVGTFDGAEYAAKIKGTTDALLSGHLGASQPSYAVEGTVWHKEVSSTVNEVYLFDGANNIFRYSYNPSTGALISVAAPDNNFALSKIAQIATARILGRTTAGTGNIETLTAAQVAAMLPEFTGDSGSGGVKGLVKAPGAGDAGKVLFGDGTWQTVSSSLPSGLIGDFAMETPPAGWLLCYGQAVSRSTYAALYAAVGDTWGAGNGTTTFNLPDFRDRVRAGLGDMGGSAAGRLSGISGLDSNAMAQVGGVSTVTLTSAQLPSISFSIGRSGSAGSSGVNAAAGGSADGSFSGGSVGSNQAHPNVQPTAIVLTCIKT